MVVLLVVDDPRLADLPYNTCVVAAALVLHETVAEFVVMLLAVTFEIVVLLPLPLPLPPLPAVNRNV